MIPKIIARIEAEKKKQRVNQDINATREYVLSPFYELNKEVRELRDEADELEEAVASAEAHAHKMVQSAKSAEGLLEDNKELARYGIAQAYSSSSGPSQLLGSTVLYKKYSTPQDLTFFFEEMSAYFKSLLTYYVATSEPFNALDKNTPKSQVVNLYLTLAARAVAGMADFFRHHYAPFFTHAGSRVVDVLPEGKSKADIEAMNKALFTEVYTKPFPDHISPEWVAANQELIAPIIRYDHSEQRFVWFNDGVDLNDDHQEQFNHAAAALGWEPGLLKDPLDLVRTISNAFKRAYPNDSVHIDFLLHVEQRLTNAVACFPDCVSPAFNEILAGLRFTGLQESEEKSFLQFDVRLMCAFFTMLLRN